MLKNVVVPKHRLPHAAQLGVGLLWLVVFAFGCGSAAPEPKTVVLDRIDKPNLMLIDFLVDSKTKEFGDPKVQSKISELATQSAIDQIKKSRGFNIIHVSIEDEAPASPAAAPNSNDKKSTKPDVVLPKPIIVDDSLELGESDSSFDVPNVRTEDAKEKPVDSGTETSVTETSASGKSTSEKTNQAEASKGASPTEDTSLSPSSESAKDGETPSKSKEDQDDPFSEEEEFVPSIEIVTNKVPLNELVAIAKTKNCPYLAMGTLRIMEQEQSYNSLKIFSLEIGLRIIEVKNEKETYANLNHTAIGFDTELVSFLEDSDKLNLTLTILKPYIDDATLELSNNYFRTLQSPKSEGKQSSSSDQKGAKKDRSDGTK